MTLARWPNEGDWERIAGYPDAGATKDEHGGKTGKLEEGFHLQRRSPRAMAGHRATFGSTATGRGTGPTTYERVASIDLDRRLVKTAAPLRDL